MKSYKECPKWKENGGMTSRTKALRMGAFNCLDAVNCRPCRRCPHVPQGKLRTWAEERKYKGAMLMSPRSNCPATIPPLTEEKKSLRPTSRKQGKIDYIVGN